MSGGWAGSQRRDELPPDWPEIRKRVFRRDGYRCTAMTPYGRCPQIATDCDHVGDRHDHSDGNLTSLCGDHHRKKTAQQGVEARIKKYTTPRRPPEVHPWQIT